MIRLRTVSGQRGEGNFGCIAWAIVFILVAFVAWKAVPVKVTSAQLHDFMDEQAKFAQNSTSDRIYKAVMNKAKELNITVDAKALRVDRTPDYIKMKIEYTIPVDFGVYVYQWHFEHVVDRPIFYF